MSTSEDQLKLIDRLGGAIVTSAFEQFLPVKALYGKVNNLKDNQLKNKGFRVNEIKFLRKGQSDFELPRRLLVLLRFGNLSNDTRKSIKDLVPIYKDLAGKSNDVLQVEIMVKIKKIAANYNSIIQELQVKSTKEESFQLEKFGDAINRVSSALIKKYEDKDEELINTLERIEEEVKSALNRAKCGRSRKTAAKLESKKQNNLMSENAENDSDKSLQVYHGEGETSVTSKRTSLSGLQGTQNNEMTSVMQRSTLSNVHHGAGDIVHKENTIIMQPGSIAIIC